MNNLDRIHARYLQDPLPQRLGGIAADLARVVSSSRHADASEVVALMLEESQHFIEWTVAEADLAIAAELVDVQIGLALWRKIWFEAQHHPGQRALLAWQAKQWSDRLLQMSGLLDSAPA